MPVSRILLKFDDNDSLLSLPDVTMMTMMMMMRMKL